MDSPRDTGTAHNPEWSERPAEHRPVLSTEEARQGATGHNVRYVLYFSIAAVIIAFAIIYLIDFA